MPSAKTDRAAVTDRLIQPGTLIVGTYKGFAPVCWSEHGIAKGLDVEFLRRR